MNTNLRPATLHALRSFQSRRRTLLLTRAALITVWGVLVAALAIALMDRMRWIPDTVRPWLTLTAYAAAIVAAWQKAGRLIRHARTHLGAAELLEIAVPSLHERLVPAIELARSGHSADHQDSPEFRATLQDQIALDVQQIDWRRTLPLSSLAPIIKGVATVLLLILALSFVPRLHLSGFLARATLPFAPIERPSSVTIRVLQPHTPTALAPFVSEVPLTAEVTGHLDGARVEVEIHENGSLPRRLEMTTAGTDQFQATLAVGQQSLSYRIAAADGLTRWFTLDARPRPATTSFTKIITPPDYVGTAPVTLIEPHGDLEVLTGSTVHLEITASEPLQNATLLLNPEDPTPPSPLETNALTPDRITATFPITADLHSWQTRLQSLETGFTNDEASPWRITPVPDGLPTVTLTEPADALQALPDEALRVLGLASDDVGLKSVELAHSTNAGPWLHLPVPTDPERDLSVQHLLNLPTLRLKGGDSLLLKWIATDLSGQTAESNSVRILVQEQTVDPRLRAWAATQQALQRTAAALNDHTDVLRDATQKIKPNDAAANPQGQLAIARAALAQAQTRTQELWDQLQQAARSAPNALATQETRILGERLAKLRQVELPRITASLNEPVELTDSLRKAASEAASLADTLTKATATFAAEATAQVASQSSEHLRRQEALLTENALEANRSEHHRPAWQEQQRAATATAAAVERDLAQLQNTASDRSIEKRLEEIREQLTEAATDLAQSLDRPEQHHSPEHLYGAADQLRNRLQRAADESRNAANTLAEKAAQLREQLNRQDNPALAALDKAKSALQEAAAIAENPKRKPSNQKDNLTPSKRAEQQLTDAARQLQDQAELHSQSLTANEATLDLNRLSRAADDMARQVANPSAPLKDLASDTESLQQVARTLATGADLKEAADLLSTALSTPPADQTTDQLAATAANTRAAAESLLQTTAPLKRDKQNQPLADLAQQAANQALSAAQNLAQQAQQAAQQPNFTPQQSAQLAQATQTAAAALDQFRPQTAAARATLDTLTPALSEMMRQLAQDLNAAQQDASQAAAKAEARQPVDQVAAEALALTPDAQANAARMEALQAALTQEANQADLAQTDQRQLARTADLALEEMRQDAPQITENLQQAAQATSSQPQAQALQNAAAAEQKTAQALQQLADSFAQMENGQPLSEQQLAGLQQMEQELGVQQALDQAYDRAKELAALEQMAQDDPNAAIALLEQELKRNPQMQKALAEIGSQTAKSAEQHLATQVNQPSFLSPASAQAAHELSRVARHEQRLEHATAAEAITAASQQLQQTADATQANPGQATPQQSQQATAAAQQATAAAAAAAAQTPSAPSANLLAQIQSAALAQALDQLDQSLHPQGSGQQPQQPSGQPDGQPSQPGQDPQKNQQQASQQLADASQSQQQSMADSRNQGQVPGSPPPPGDMAQNGNPPPSENAQQSTDGSSMNPQGEIGVLAGEVIVVDGDWGSLPAHTADDLTEATRQDAPPEYRAAIENYYKAIATKARE